MAKIAPTLSYHQAVLFQIRQMMLKLDQPVSFDAQSYEEVDNPRVDLLNQLHNEVLISCQECM